MANFIALPFLFSIPCFGILVFAGLGFSFQNGFGHQMRDQADRAQSIIIAGNWVGDRLWIAICIDEGN
jgi:hypothetical protein